MLLRQHRRGFRDMSCLLATPWNYRMPVAGTRPVHKSKIAPDPQVIVYWQVGNLGTLLCFESLAWQDSRMTGLWTQNLPCHKVGMSMSWDHSIDRGQLVRVLAEKASWWWRGFWVSWIWDPLATRIFQQRRNEERDDPWNHGEVNQHIDSKLNRTFCLTSRRSANFDPICRHAGPQPAWDIGTAAPQWNLESSLASNEFLTASNSH